MRQEEEQPTIIEPEENQGASLDEDEGAQEEENQGASLDEDEGAQEEENQGASMDESHEEEDTIIAEDINDGSIIV